MSHERTLEGISDMFVCGYMGLEIFVQRTQLNHAQKKGITSALLQYVGNILNSHSIECLANTIVAIPFFSSIQNNNKLTIFFDFEFSDKTLPPTVSQYAINFKYEIIQMHTNHLSLSHSTIKPESEEGYKNSCLIAIQRIYTC